jgi:hypothetical protein
MYSGAAFGPPRSFLCDVLRILYVVERSGAIKRQNRALAAKKPSSRGIKRAVLVLSHEWSSIVDLSLWEKARRYRRIAAFAGDEESPRPAKSALRPDDAAPELKPSIGPAGKSMMKD